jgi:hypothetical protein
MARAIKIGTGGDVTEVDVDLHAIVELLSGRPLTIKVPAIHNAFPAYDNDEAEDIQPVLLATDPNGTRETRPRNQVATDLFIPRDQQEHEHLSGDVYVVDQGEDDDWEEVLVPLQDAFTVAHVQQIIEESQE